MTEQQIPQGLHHGLEDFMFVIAGSNNVLDQYKYGDRNNYNLIKWREIILRRAQKLHAKGIVYKHLLVPEKISILPDMLRDIEVDTQMSPARRFYVEDPLWTAGAKNPLSYLRHIWRQHRWHSINIDLFGPMTVSQIRKQLYFKVDSHWSYKGRQLAYERVCAALGTAPMRDFESRKLQHIPEFAGDLGGRCQPQITEDVHIVLAQQDAVRIYTNPIVPHRERLGLASTLHTGTHVAYRNDKASDPRRLLLFGDSFSNWVPIMLTILLAETFRELHFVWSTSIDYGLVYRVKPDIVLTEMAERFMDQLVEDDFDVEAYAQERYGAELTAA